jgi:cytochrome P450
LADVIDELSAHTPVEDIDVDTLLSLPLLDAVINESMRLITPAPFMSFRMAQDREIAGQAFAGGSRFFVLSHLTHRLPDLKQRLHAFTSSPPPP